MANWWHVQRLKRGVNGWNRWREKHPKVKLDLSKVNLTYILSGTGMGIANLSEAECRFTVFTDNDFRTAKGLALINHFGPSGSAQWISII